MTAAATAIHLDEPTVALAGDWHGNLGWVAQALPAIRRADASVRTVMHVGDFGLWCQFSTQLRRESHPD